MSSQRYDHFVQEIHRRWSYPHWAPHQLQVPTTSHTDFFSKLNEKIKEGLITNQRKHDNITSHPCRTVEFPTESADLTISVLCPMAMGVAFIENSTVLHVMLSCLLTQYIYWLPQRKQGSHGEVGKPINILGSDWSMWYRFETHPPFLKIGQDHTSLRLWTS